MAEWERLEVSSWLGRRRKVAGVQNTGAGGAREAREPVPGTPGGGPAHT